MERGRPQVKRKRAGHDAETGLSEPSTSRSDSADPKLRNEIISRLLSQVRAARDHREVQFKKEYVKDFPEADDHKMQEFVGEYMAPLNDCVQSLEQCTMSGIPLEDLLKSTRYAVVDALARSPTKSIRSPERRPTLDPLAIKVEDLSVPRTSQDGNLLAVNGGPVSAVETNVEKAAKQEQQIIGRIAELRRNGMWTQSLLPLCVEPPRNKTHWDYVLEEVKWMANDFRQERIVKRNMARKVASAIAKQFRDREREVEMGEEKEKREAKRVCASIAKMIREFWTNVDKVVDYRARSIIESKKRKALDKHLSFLVGEADKLSSLVQDGLQQEKLSRTPSVCDKDDLENDAEFEVGESESDDETTIAKDERALKDHDVEGEVNELQKEGDMEMDDFLASLPAEYLQSLGMHPTPSVSTPVDKPQTPPTPEESESEEEEEDTDDEKEEEAEEEEEKADEEGPSSAKKARHDGDENEMMDDSERVETAEKSGEEKDLEEKLKTEGNGDGRGMLEKVDYSKLNSENSDERQTELDNIAEEALKFQPKGFTLETTTVKTQVPFLIRGKLREYQMVGLDWLVTLYEKNLNGILADEMGLGKTIQTIAVLAHLACAESIWGPHLIIVPTSVILNWEMEFKKWCPALKILTYFGSVKERAEKRKGWTKPNSFHVCITSYKTVTTDIRSFKMKAWQYMILDEAQNIKNWKSQRWQALLNVRARRRLLLTGTPLQNSLMELWSLMHFLMPAIFSSHDDFKDWFSNPLTGMMDGSVEYNAPLVQRLHKVLRPFILRRLKSEVEKQLPSKTEHILKCALSKRQRYLYDDFMSRRTTRDNLRSGNMMSVLNIVMQLRKCCNHPNLFEPRPVVAPFAFRSNDIVLPGLVMNICDPDVDLEQKKIPEGLDLTKRMSGWSTDVTSKRPLIEELDSTTPQISPPKMNGFKFVRPVGEKGPGPSQTQAPGPIAVSGVPGEEVPMDDPRRGGNAPLLVSRTAATAPVATNYNSPGTANDNPRPTNLRPHGEVFGKQTNKEVNIQSSFRSTTVMTPLSPLAVHTAQDGFHTKMLNGGTKESTLRYQFSPPLKRRKMQSRPVVTGDYKELVPDFAMSHLKTSRVMRLERVQERFGQLHRPLIANELISVLSTEVRQVNRVDNDPTWKWNGWNSRREEIDEMKEAELAEMEGRYFVYVPRGMCQPSRLSITAGSHAYSIHREKMKRELCRELIDREDPLIDRILVSQRLQFPELRLIEYDCGKLQQLGNLLRDLFLYKHRCLIFTQMSKMLDVLQAFLSFHGYQYFRLDGSTHIEQRQAMMERFNADPKIFCFILSTRSGGVGINLTGADTVIFYDSDWNPTMDAQAQDRCHRIGQTRNVSIYRLISERTIEENILKKAMQKRRLGEMAIDEAGFTPEFFKKSDNIRDLFEGEDIGDDAPLAIEGPKDQRELEKAMATLEDEQDVVAARLLSAETKADRAEFEENSRQGALGDDEPPDDKYLELIQQLTPIERYAVSFLEEEYKPEFVEECKEAEAMIEQKKSNWVKAHEKAIAEEEEAEAEELLMYDGGNLLEEFFADGDDFLDQFMPTWMPPTPPLSDSELDAFLDTHWDVLYETELMGETRLPAFIHEPERILDKHQTPVKAPTPIPSDSPMSTVIADSPIHMEIAPSSSPMPTYDYGNSMSMHSMQDLGGPTHFDYSKRDPIANACLDDALEVMKQSSMTSSTSNRSRVSGSRGVYPRSEMRAPMTPPPADREEPDYDGPEWTIVEDMALLNAVKNEQRATHAAGTSRAGLKMNWDYVAGYVNRTTGYYRSPRQCCLRYQNAVLPREEGRLVTTCPITKKVKKIVLNPAEVVHMRNSRTTTADQYVYDAGKVMHGKLSNKLKTIRGLVNRRPQPFRRYTDLSRVDAAGLNIPLEQDLKLQQWGISYNSPRLPVTVLDGKEEIRSQHSEHSRRDQHPYAQTSQMQLIDDDKETWGREMRVCVRAPAIPCPKETLQFRTNLVIDIPPSPRPTAPAMPQQPTSHVEMRSTGGGGEHGPGPSSIPHSQPGPIPRRVTLGPSGGQHIMSQQSGNYAIVVNPQDGNGAPSRLPSFVQRSDGSAGQPPSVYRTLAPVAPKRTPPATPAPRIPVYASSSNAQQVYSTGGGEMQMMRGVQPMHPQRATPQQNLRRVMQGVPQQQQNSRMFVSQQRDGNNTFVVPNANGQPMRMVPRGMGPAQKRTANGAKAPQGNVALMIQQRPAPGQQGVGVRPIARSNYPQQQPGGPRVVSMVTMPSSSRQDSPQMQQQRQLQPQYAHTQAVQPGGSSGMGRPILTSQSVVRQLGSGGQMMQRNASPQQVQHIQQQQAQQQQQGGSMHNLHPGMNTPPTHEQQMGGGQGQQQQPVHVHVSSVPVSHSYSQQMPQADHHPSNQQQQQGPPQSSQGLGQGGHLKEESK